MKTDEQTLYWDVVEAQGWRLYAAVAVQGLCFVGSNGQGFEELENWAASAFPHSELVKDEAVMKPYLTQLKAYLDGQLEAFTIPQHLRGTPFQRAVWDAVCAVPYGETRTYSDIAQQISKPNAVRAVGTAIGANPLLLSIPCHRIVGKNGALTGYRGGLDMKRRLLELEKASF